MRRPLTAYALFLPFALCILATWAWFNTDIGARPSTLDSGHPPRLWLLARTNIPGYTFIPEPVGESVMKTLGTTNILSGTFVRIEKETKDSEVLGPSSLVPGPASRVTVFLASWPDGDNNGLTLIQHTPDICWGGSGWKPLNLGQPSQITVSIPTQEGGVTTDHQPPTTGRSVQSTDQIGSPWSVARGSHFDRQLSTTNSQPLPFDFRIFDLSNSQDREATAWCVLAGGRALITTEWGRACIPRDNVAYYFWSRAVQFRQILKAAQGRIPVRQQKQFVRYSAPLEADSSSVMGTMNTFGTAWLSAAPL